MCNTTYTNNTKIHSQKICFQQFLKIKKLHICQKVSLKYSALYVDFYGIIYILYFIAILRFDDTIKKQTIGRGPFRTKDPQTSQTNDQYENCSHFWDIFGFCERMSKKHLKPCSHIELNTQNPNPIFKITIYCTKQTNDAKIHSNLLEKVESFEKQK